MKRAESNAAYATYRDNQIEWASEEDLLLIAAKELVRLKEETGMDLFWDKEEEQRLREYIEDIETVFQC